MADVTISELNNITPNSSASVPISQDGTTYSTTLGQLSALPFIPKAWVVFQSSASVLTVHSKYPSSVTVTRVSTGIYDIGFPVGLFADGFYAIAGMAGFTTSLNMMVISQNYGYNASTATNCRISIGYANGNLSDPLGIARLVFFR
jgi:hypothetical protein